MTQSRSTTLYCREGSADKEYQICLEATDGGYLVNFAFGRRGGPLKSGTKTNQTIDYAAATKIYDKLLKEKASKGYTESESGMRYVGTDLESRDSGLSPQLPTAIQPKEVEYYQKNDAWVAQEKYDGENRMIVITGESTHGINRRGLTCPVPAHWDTKAIPSDEGRTVVCGEDMGVELVAFDMVERNGRCIRHLNAVDRHIALNQLVAEIGNPEWLIVAPMAISHSEKAALLHRMHNDKGEGVVYKRASSTFDEGRSTNSMKFKIQESSTFEVVKVNDQRSVAIALYDEAGNLVPISNVTVPANYPIPQVGALVEVEYMYRFEGGALMQPKYRGERSDIEGPVRMTQIQRIKAKSLAA